MEIVPIYQIKRARQLREASTEVEKRLWNRLRARQLDGHKFRRQHPVGNAILDFGCEVLKLGIELDGGQHTEDKMQMQDARRTALMQEVGWELLRLWNHEVIENIDGVLTVIMQALTRRAQEHPLRTSPKGEVRKGCCLRIRKK